MIIPPLRFISPLFSHFDPCSFLSPCGPFVLILTIAIALSFPFSCPLPLFSSRHICCAIYFFGTQPESGTRRAPLWYFQIRRMPFWFIFLFSLYYRPSFCIWLFPAYPCERRSCLVNSILSHKPSERSIFIFFVTQRMIYTTVCSLCPSFLFYGLTLRKVPSSAIEELTLTNSIQFQRHLFKQERHWERLSVDCWQERCRILSAASL